MSCGPKSTVRLRAAAKAERLWSEALKEKDFSEQVEVLHCFYIPSFEICATVMLAQLKEQLMTFVVEPDSYEQDELGMMILLGFFQLRGQRYQMTVPSRPTLAKVKKAALTLLKTEDA